MAEATSKTIEGDNQPQSVVKILFIRGTKAAQNDTFTVSGLTTVIGVYLQFASGAVETETYSTNVITLTSATTGVISGLVWGT